MQQPWPACRSAKGGLYTWSQSTPNSIILERVSCVSSTKRLFTCAEPRCCFASCSVFIMMALFCLLVGGGCEHAIAWSGVILPMCFLCSFSWADNVFVFSFYPAPCPGSSNLFPLAVKYYRQPPFYNKATGYPTDSLHIWVIYNM